MKRILSLLFIAVGLALALYVSNGVATAQSGNTWTLFYFANTEWSGNSLYHSTAPLLNFNWHGASPAPNIPGTNWSMTATSPVFFYGGQYQFDALADDEVVLLVDNAIVIDTRGRNQVGKRQLQQFSMTEGTHNLQVSYRQFGGDSYLYLTWTYLKPGPQPPPPPPAGPTPPPSASSVTTPFGDFTPCIQAHEHQSVCFAQNGTWDTPNLGSIQMEPQITIWGNCSPADSDIRWVVDPNSNPPRTQGFRCSKTLAGWFPT